MSLWRIPSWAAADSNKVDVYKRQVQGIPPLGRHLLGVVESLNGALGGQNDRPGVDRAGQRARPCLVTAAQDVYKRQALRYITGSLYPCMSPES